MRYLIAVFCLIASISPNHLFAQPLRLAVAANAQFVVKALQAEFQKTTGIETEIIVGSSGNLATQISNGAPFDVFLSADMVFPTQLQKKGFTLTAPKVYALGSLILCSLDGFDMRVWKTLLLSDKIKKIAIANPAVAPYGLAAQQVLKKHNIWEKVKSKIVYGESISQVNTYIITQTVALGFTTEALLYESVGARSFKWIRIDKSDYAEIRQGFVVLKHARANGYNNAMKFSQFLTSPASKNILKKFGYRVS